MLVGRDAERQAVDALVAGARLGRSGVLVLTGEAGIGKTSLLDYARSVATGARLLRVTGSEAERDVPFGGLAQLFRPTAADLDRLPPPQAQALGVALALRSGPVAERLAVGAAVLSLLVRWSEDRPLGLVVDDAHLLDRP
ncbi:MAG TPA: ATP-binding protein [Mycobacteriales bacterium]